jgi:hypothetical protein
VYRGKMISSPETLEATSVEIFRQSAESFCTLIEEPRSEPRQGALEAFLVALSEIYYLGLLLPQIEPSTNEWPLDDIAAREASVRSTLSALIGRDDVYWLVFNPQNNPPKESVAGMLSADLSEIWGDLKGGLLTLERYGEAALDDVHWDWRFSLKSHWGSHAVNALAALHSLVQYS